MLNLGSIDEKELCGVCVSPNPASASWCSTCGEPLGVDPDFLSAQIERAPPLGPEVSLGALHPERPRLWVSGGPGAWLLTEDANGALKARILDQHGVATQFEAGVSLGPFDQVMAVEATRRGLFVLFEERLRLVSRPFPPSLAWPVKPVTDVALPPGRAVGLSAARDGQLYLASQDGGRLVLWRGGGQGAWRRLASCAGKVEGWLEFVVDRAGDALFWGQGRIGAFEADRRRLTMTHADPVAPLPLRLSARTMARGEGVWRNWRRDQPVLAACQDKRLGLIHWGEGGPALAVVSSHVAPPLASAAATGAVLARSAEAVFRLVPGTGGQVQVREGRADATNNAVAAPRAGGALFLLVRGESLVLELVRNADQIPEVTDSWSFERSGAVAMLGAGFDPLAICGYFSSRPPAHELWVAMQPKPGGLTPAALKVARFSCVGSAKP
ncbi:hypothetical protein QO010_003526 [Caulobacter ginsengisoli]|uniref:Zinc ribbon domain-containing protein n=1 Tax=Caulobacter ginsengisoli TaxID=400775 RepID=A0ABU0IXF4_9CAUL|nr:hypothetical protein [Caulobacter ginsengisoli]MDQ0465734.1 hypothetical protein [Caulobacter ginsengisoli]